MKKRTVAIYSPNLVLSTIGACLQQKPEFRIVRIEGSIPDYLKKKGAARPEVILFDLMTVQSHFAVSLMHHHPEIKLIGVDLTGHKMLVFSGESSHLLTVEDLVTVIGENSG